MDIKQEDLQSDKENPSQLNSSTRFTPGKFTFGDTSIDRYQKSDERNNSNSVVNNYMLFTPKIDTAAIWNTSSDIQRSFSVPSSTDVNCGNNNALSTIWNTKHESVDAGRESPTFFNPTSEYSIPNSHPLTLSVGTYEAGPDYQQHHNTDRYNEPPVFSEEKHEVVDVEEQKRIQNVINSIDGWGVKPVNQKTPWETSEIVGPGVTVAGTGGRDPLNGVAAVDGYPDTFSNWLNDNTPNGASAWETYDTAKTQTFTQVPAQSWAAISNETPGWPTAVGSINKPVTNGFSPDLSTSLHARRLGFGRFQNDQIKKNMNWMHDSKSMGDFQSACNNGGNGMTSESFYNQRNKKFEIELHRLKLYKEAQKQMTDEYIKERQKCIELEKNVQSLKMMLASGEAPQQSRAVLYELLTQYEAGRQRLAGLQLQMESLSTKLSPLEEMLETAGALAPIATGGGCVRERPLMSGSNATTKPGYGGQLDHITSKIGYMRVQSTQDFRLDVPEFVPGKKWYGLNQNGKENRMPLHQHQHQQHPGPMSAGPTSMALPPAQPGHMIESNSHNGAAVNPSMCWLLIQNLPAHVSIDMMHSLFNQNATPCATPLHCNPFSRWMLVKFNSAVLCQKAYQLLCGKIGSVSIINDHEAALRLQELKGVMANFVAHQN